MPRGEADVGEAQRRGVPPRRRGVGAKQGGAEAGPCRVEGLRCSALPPGRRGSGRSARPRRVAARGRRRSAPGIGGNGGRRWMAAGGARGIGLGRDDRMRAAEDRAGARGDIYRGPCFFVGRSWAHEKPRFFVGRGPDRRKTSYFFVGHLAHENPLNIFVS